MPHDPPNTNDVDLLALDQPGAMDGCTRVLARDGQALNESIFILRGLRCAACAQTIEQSLARAGVLAAQVQFASERARVIWSPQQIVASAIVQAIRQAGYDAVPAHSIIDEDARRRAERQALWRLLVAGFCMMQVMMYAVPAYYMNPGEVSPDIDRLLRWAGWLLTLPVLLFACKPFFASALTDLRRGQIGMDFPVALGIVITFAAGTSATFQPDGILGSELYFDSLTMFVFFLLAGRWLEQKLKRRTAGAVEAIVQRLPQSVLRIQGEVEARVAISQLKVGDQVRILAGQAFPGDGVLLDQPADVDEALLTGEAQAITRMVGDAVIAGSYNLAGPVLVRLTRLGADTRFGQIAALMDAAACDKPRLAQLADRIAAPFLLIVLAAAAAAAMFWWWHAPQLAPAMPIKVAIAILIVTCPCALSLATPAALLAAAGALAKRGMLVRSLQSIETLARADLFVFDKTGTLTSDCPTVVAIETRAGITSEEATTLAAALARHSIHPVARALQANARIHDADIALDNISETAGAGLSATHAAYGRIRLGSAQHAGVALSDETASACYLADDHGLLARFLLAEAIKPHAAASVATLQARGAQVWLLSGDQAAAVDKVASATRVNQALAAQSPEAKRLRIQAAQRAGHCVAMIGDGLNDGPVLAQADLSIALGQAAPLAQSRADILILSGDPADVAQAHHTARRAMQIVRQNLRWAAIYNAVCIPLAITGQLPPWLAGLGMAASSLLVVGNALRVR